jgi:hypothetical protein
VEVRSVNANLKAALYRRSGFASTSSPPSPLCHPEPALSLCLLSSLATLVLPSNPLSSRATLCHPELVEGSRSVIRSEIPSAGSGQALRQAQDDRTGSRSVIRSEILPIRLRSGQAIAQDDRASPSSHTLVIAISTIKSKPTLPVNFAPVFTRSPEVARERARVMLNLHPIRGGRDAIFRKMHPEAVYLSTGNHFV